MNSSLNVSNIDETVKIALSIIEASNDIIVISEAEPIDQPGPRIIYVNPAFEKETGYSAQEVIGKTPRILQGPKTDEATKERIRNALSEWKPIQEEILNYKKNGEEVWHNLNIFPIADDSGMFTHWVAIQHNITERKMAEHSYWQSQQSLKKAMQAGGIGVWEWDVVNDIFVWSLGMCEIYGMEEHEFSGSYIDWQNAVHPDDRAMVNEGIRNAINGKECNIKFRIIWSDSSIHNIRLQAFFIKNSEGNVVRLVGTNWDITEYVIAQKETEELILIDPLTGLPNSRLLNDRLNQALILNHRIKHYGALLFIDLDKFKSINDIHGHVTGSNIIIEVSKRLKNCFRESDTVSRYGGDEFIILLTDLDNNLDSAMEKIKTLSEYVRMALNVPFETTVITDDDWQNKIMIQCSASIGITMFNGDNMMCEKIISMADTAMYIAKKKGGNRVEFSKLPLRWLH